MSVNFNPVMGATSGQGAFRFWCQKVMPLVYDDSLSYYELLCKVVNYLNTTMEDVNIIGENTNNIYNAFIQLQDYVNNYFNSLDIESEINAKLDNMASDGTLTLLLESFVPNLVATWLADNITPTSPVIDKTLKISGAGADSKITGDNVFLTNEIIKDNIGYISESLEQEWVYGLYDYDGNINESSVYQYSMCNVEQNKYYTFKGTYGFNAPNYLFLDSENNVVSYGKLSSTISHDNIGTTFITPPANAVKLIVNGSTSDVESKALINCVSNFTLQSETQKTTNSNIVNVLFENSKTENLATNVLQGKLIDDKGEIIDYGNTSYCVSVLGVKSGEFYRIKGNSNYSNYGYATFDVNNNLLKLYSQGGSSNTPVPFDDILFIEPNVKYICVASNIAVGELSINKIIGIGTNSWKKLKWTCIGDSLTEVNSRTDKRYYEYIQDITGISVYNMGESGSGYAKKADSNSAFYQRILDTPLDSTVVTIFGSGNDLSALELGDVNDSGTTTICGCINTTIDNLYSILPTVQLGIITPTPWAGHDIANSSDIMTQYCDKIIEICRNRGIPYLDLYRCSNFRPNNAEYRALVFSKDDGGGVHPNELGHKIISSHINVFLETLISTY